MMLESNDRCFHCGADLSKEEGMYSVIGYEEFKLCEDCHDEWDSVPEEKKMELLDDAFDELEDKDCYSYFIRCDLCGNWMSSGLESYKCPEHICKNCMPWDEVEWCDATESYWLLDEQGKPQIGSIYNTGFYWTDFDR